MKKHYKPKPPRTHEKCAKCGKELTEYEVMYGPIHKCQPITVKDIPNEKSCSVNKKRPII